MNKKKILASVMAVLSVAALIVGSLALFTDRFQSKTEITAGTLDLVLSQTWAADNAAVAGNFKPGEALKLNYSLANEGNMAVNVRETFVLSCDVPLNDPSAVTMVNNPGNINAHEFDIYNAEDVTIAADGTVTAITGSPLTCTRGEYVTEGGKTWYKLTYQIPEFIMNGSIENVDDAIGLSKSGSYVLVFRNDVSNEFQEANIIVEYMAQGLQNGNTGAETWTDAKVITETVNFGGANVNVMPEHN